MGLAMTGRAHLGGTAYGPVPTVASHVLPSFSPPYHKCRRQTSCANTHLLHALLTTTCARTAALCRHRYARTRQSDRSSGTKLKPCDAHVLLRHVRGSCLRGRRGLHKPEQSSVPSFITI